MENEVVAEKTPGILYLKKVAADGREGFEFDGEGFGFARRKGGGDTAAVDDDVGFFGHVAGIQGHRFLAVC